MKIKLLLIAVFCIGGFAAQATDPGDGKKDEINGNVIHADNKKPLKEVAVTAYLNNNKEQSIKTDNVGSFSFDELKPGTYKFVFEKTGYKKITKENVIIKTDEAFLLNIEMIESKEFQIMPSPFQF